VLPRIRRRRRDRVGVVGQPRWLVMFTLSRPCRANLRSAWNNFNVSVEVVVVTVNTGVLFFVTLSVLLLPVSVAPSFRVTHHRRRRVKGHRDGGRVRARTLAVRAFAANVCVMLLGSGVVTRDAPRTRAVCDSG